MISFRHNATPFLTILFYISDEQPEEGGTLRRNQIKIQALWQTAFQQLTKTFNKTLSGMTEIV